MNTQDTNDTQQPTLPLETTADPLVELKAENDRLKDSLRMRDAHDELLHRLKKAGARTPKLLFESAKHALKFTADGLLENALETIEDLRSRYPEQFRSNAYEEEHLSIGAGNNRPAGPGLTREALAKMSPEQIARLDWAEVRRVLAGK